ncbi:M48 family metallopeptidase [Desulfobacterales bacterium HSG16]|nr:M48 family metallopeptidase [Desulfobacterales bacterium HSG16]
MISIQSFQKLSKRFFYHCAIACLPILIILSGVYPAFGQAQNDKADKTANAQADNAVEQEKAEEAAEARQRFFRSNQADPAYEFQTVAGDHLSVEGFKRYGLPLENKALQKYINTVGATLARNSKQSNNPCYFTVIKNPSYLSWACPGGVVVVSSGLLKVMEDESELACVLAREIAHLSRKDLLRTLGRIKDLKKESYEGVIKNMAATLFETGFSQETEFAADAFGMEIAYKTGYDPAGYIRVLERLEAEKSRGSQKEGWFATHPPVSSQIKNSKKILLKYPDHSEMARVSKRFSDYKGMIPE